MKLILKYKKEIILSIVIAISYFALRLVYLSELPLFTDEAIYIRWAQIALQDASWRFISLTDGKQPMFVWFAMVFLNFIEDPLIAGRLVSVASGFFTLVGLFFLTYELFKNKTTAFVSSILYVFYPFAQVLDRMALYDSMVAAFCVWSLYFSILLIRTLRLDVAYTLGLVIAGGVLTKSNAFFSIYLLPFLFILFDFKKKQVFKRVLTFISLALFSSVLGYGAYNVLRLSPLFEIISIKNANFAYPFSEWINHPFTYFTSNLSGFLSWLTQYLGISYMVLILISLILIKKYMREKMLLVLYFLLPFLAICLFGNVIYPRFIYFMSLFLLPLAAWGLNQVIEESLFYSSKKEKAHIARKLIPIILLVFIWYPALISFRFAYDPINSQIAKADNSQYVNSWAAGWGVKESLAFFKDKAKNQKIYIATEGTFGLMPYALEMYLVSNKNVTIKGYWPIDKFPEEVSKASKTMPAYFIFYQKEHIVIPSEFPLKLIFQVKQGNTNSYYRVYQVIPQN